MAQPLIPIPDECDRILVIIPSSRLQRAVVSQLNDVLFPLWQELVSFIVLDALPQSLITNDEKFDWLLNQIVSESRLFAKRKVLRPGKEGLPNWAYAVTRSAQFEKIVETEIRFAGASGVHKHLSDQLSPWSYAEIDHAFKEGVWKRTYPLKPWINQWIELGLGHLGCAVARAVRFVSSKTIVQRLCQEAFSDTPQSDKLPCYVILFEGPTLVEMGHQGKSKQGASGSDHDSNALLDKALVASLDSRFGVHCYYLGLNPSDINSCKEYGVKRKDRDYSPIDWSRVERLVMIDEVNISGHKAYAKEKGATSQLQKLQQFASSKGLAYLLRFAYSTKIGFEYQVNPKWDSTFSSPYFSGIEIGPGENPLFEASQSRPMAFEFVNSEEEREAGKIVGECLSPGNPLGTGGMATTIIFATVTPANTYPPLLKAGKKVEYEGRSVASWRPLAEDRRPQS